METLSWFGSYGSTLVTPVSAIVAMMVMVFLTNGLLAFASGNGQTALLRTGFVSMAFLFISFFILVFLFFSGGAEEIE